tara:strand:+ start:90 stop:554 length:465 start_codon:yes stop_codon:yes gene_type:complete
MIRSAAWVLAALPILGACLTTSDPSTETATEPIPKQTQTPTYPPETLKPSNPVAEPEAATPTHPNIKILKGKTSEKLTELLGAPDFRRTDKPAELWQYRHDKCSVDLFMYPRDGGGLRVDFLDVRIFGDHDLSLQACFVAILKAKATAGGLGKG